MFGLYIHVPFCPQRCPYCAFVTVVGHEEWHERYCKAVEAEVAMASFANADGPLDSVFFGGGTPSHVAAENLETILEAAAKRFGVRADAEITLEANPDAVDVSRFSQMKSIGVNRLSIGAQSFADGSLKMLGRLHSGDEALSAYDNARRVGFDNVSIDLIFGVPGVPDSDWEQSIRTAIALDPEHISTYGLTVEEGTSLYEKQRRGRWQSVTEKTDCWATEHAVALLESIGYQRYEVSNFAKKGFFSRHNWGYWRGGRYMGVGVSSHSFDGRKRYWNVRNIKDYMESIEAGVSAVEGSEQIDNATYRQERVWLELRTAKGITLSTEQTERLTKSERFRDMRDAGFLTLGNGSLSLTTRGFLVADSMGVEVSDLLETGPR